MVPFPCHFEYIPELLHEAFLMIPIALSIPSLVSFKAIPLNCQTQQLPSLVLNFNSK